MDRCTVDELGHECGEEVVAHGLCMKHYARKRRTGSVYTGAEQKDRLVEQMMLQLHDIAGGGDPPPDEIEELLRQAREMGYGREL